MHTPVCFNVHSCTSLNVSAFAILDCIAETTYFRFIYHMDLQLIIKLGKRRGNYGRSPYRVAYRFITQYVSDCMQQCKTERGMGVAKTIDPLTDKYEHHELAHLLVFSYAFLGKIRKERRKTSRWKIK